jgi:hypothetical protein
MLDLRIVATRRRGVFGWCRGFRRRGIFTRRVAVGRERFRVTHSTGNAVTFSAYIASRAISIALARASFVCGRGGEGQQHSEDDFEGQQGGSCWK